MVWNIPGCMGCPPQKIIFVQQNTHHPIWFLICQGLLKGSGVLKPRCWTLDLVGNMWCCYGTERKRSRTLTTAPFTRDQSGEGTGRGESRHPANVIQCTRCFPVPEHRRVTVRDLTTQGREHLTRHNNVIVTSHILSHILDVTPSYPLLSTVIA